jgi:hypothetical protein
VREGPIAIPIINGRATLVKLPDSARFALHKLVVSIDRPVTAQRLADQIAPGDRQTSGKARRRQKRLRSDAIMQRNVGLRDDAAETPRIVDDQARRLNDCYPQTTCRKFRV